MANLNCYNQELLFSISNTKQNMGKFEKLLTAQYIKLMKSVPVVYVHTVGKTATWLSVCYLNIKFRLRR